MATKPATIDDYIAPFPPKVRAILKRIRQTIRKAAPMAEETISYQIPTFIWHGPLVHFAAFKEHIGFYPPVRGDAKLVKAAASYANAKGNLRFPLDEPIPYALIAAVTRHHVRQTAVRRSGTDRPPRRNSKAKTPAKSRTRPPTRP